MTQTLGTRFRAMLLLALVASFGFSMGIITDRLLFARPAHPSEVVEGAPREPVMRILTREGMSGPSPTGGSVLFPFGPPGWLTEELELTASQTAEVERVLTESQEALREVVTRFEPEMSAVIEETRMRILEVLTQEQVERWEDLSDQQSRILLRR